MALYWNIGGGVPYQQLLVRGRLERGGRGGRKQTGKEEEAKVVFRMKR